MIAKLQTLFVVFAQLQYIASRGEAIDFRVGMRNKVWKGALWPIHRPTLSIDTCQEWGWGTCICIVVVVQKMGVNPHIGNLFLRKLTHYAHRGKIPPRVISSSRTPTDKI